MPYVFDFDHRHARPPMELKDLLGGKGANLAEMTSVLKLPVPPGSPSPPMPAGTTWPVGGREASRPRWPPPAPAWRRPWAR